MFCGKAVSYRLFLGARVSLAREQGLWKAAAAEVQTGTASQVSPGEVEVLVSVARACGAGAATYPGVSRALRRGP